MLNGRPEDAAIAGHLEDRYGLTTARLTLPEGHNPFVVRVRRHDGIDWIARLFPPKRPRHRVDEEAELLDHLESRDYPAERCAVDEPVSTLDGWTVLVTEYAGEGAQENPAIAPRFFTEDAYEALGDLLGRLHALEPGDGSWVRPGGAWHGDPAYEGLPSEDIEATRAMLEPLDATVPESRRVHYESLRARVAELGDRWNDALPNAISHPDFMWKNVVLAPTGSFIAVDWTGAGLGPRVCNLVDLANTTAEHGDIDVAKLRGIARGYRRHIELTRDEFDAVADARRIRQLRFAVMTYEMSARYGRFGDGSEGWWPNDGDNQVLSDAIRSVFADS
jgi:Ser/Thr protein kinase RdoA (MazF antagonist)